MSMARFGRLRPLTILLLAFVALMFHSWLTHEAAATIAEEAAPMSETCALSGGTSSLEGSLFQCCWPGWGCLKCAVVGDGTTPYCWMQCSSKDCESANALDPSRPRFPRSVSPDAFSGQMSPVRPPKTKKPLTADPGAGTVQ